MARPLRIEYPGAWYHVMNRGSGRQTLFHDIKHYELFLSLLEDVHNRHQLEVHAYCLMSNHYHLFVRTPHPNLSKVMRHINGVFTQKYNKINKKDGALFRGRYKSILVDADSYLLQLSRYIHLNPVAAGIVQNPGDYPWSSYPSYITVNKKPQWLYCDETLSHFGSGNQISNYKRFISEGIDDKVKFFFSNLKKFPILGSDAFIEKTKNNHIKALSIKEIPEQLKVMRYLSPTVEDVISVVAEYYNTSTLRIVTNVNRKLRNLPRKVAIYLAFEVTGQNQRTIAKSFKGISYSSVSRLCHGVRVELGTNNQLVEDIKKIKKTMTMGSQVRIIE